MTKPALAITSFLTIMMLALPSSVLAESSAADSTQTDTSGRSSVQFDQPTASPGQTTTGYTDSNGKPISYDQYLQTRKDSSKNVLQRDPIQSALVILIVVSAIYYFAFYRKKAAKN